MRIPVVLFAFSFVCLSAAAEVANLSGSWWLNAGRSRWDDKQPAPNSVALEIQHSEPSLKYKGTVNRSQEDAPVTFEFNGAIDGKQYPAREDQHDRKMQFVRKSERVIESESVLSDGKTKEHSTLTLSSDGKTLERKMQVREGDRVVREWTEIYEKRR